MGKYANESMEELAAELSAGLARLRKGYVDSAEKLLRIVNPDEDYPLEFVMFRLTGYRKRDPKGSPETMAGKPLRQDLLRLLLDVCDSANIRTSEYQEPVYDTSALARQFRVSTKTVQRWRRRGLPARKLVFPDGKKRIAFLEGSVQWFVKDRPGQIRRSMRFSQMTDAERADIVRRARRMAASRDCCLSDVAKHLAARTGRAVETIRYTVRKHDMDHPGEAVFRQLPSPLDDEEKMTIYRCYLRGVPVPALARRYHRTRGSIYRIVNEMRARQLLNRPISFMFNAQFSLPNADELVLKPDRERREARKKRAPARPPADLPPYLRALYDVPLLDPQQEHDLFRKYNYLKYKADKLRKKLDVNHIRTRDLKEIEKLLVQANVTKNSVIRANLRLVVSIAKRHVGGPQNLFELISDGNVSLMRAVEKFDYSRGNRFSTYASWAIMRNFARSVPKERFHLDRFATGYDEILDIAASLHIYDPNEVNIPELRECIDVVLAQLSPTERSILIDHYGLEEGRGSRTLEQLGKRFGISKERVRQIEIRALKKLREILHPQEADLLT